MQQTIFYKLIYCYKEILDKRDREREQEGRERERESGKMGGWRDIKRMESSTFRISGYLKDFSTKTQLSTNQSTREKDAKKFPVSSGQEGMKRTSKFIFYFC